MSDYEFLSQYQEEYFGYLAEFFKRIVGRTAEEFASEQIFIDELKKDAGHLADRDQTSFAWVEGKLRGLYSGPGAKVFGALKGTKGLKLVVGGSGRFGEDHIAAIKRTVLYSDTVLIPDPVMPWLETARAEEKFRHVEMLRSVFLILQVRPLTEPSFLNLPIIVFPSWEKLSEERDGEFQKAQIQLVTDVLAFHIDTGLCLFSDVIDYVDTHPDDFLRKVDEKGLFIPPNGEIGDSIGKALAKYREFLVTWRTTDYLAKIKDCTPAQLTLMGIAERLAPQYHLFENAEELGSYPLLCLEQHAYYYRLITDTYGERLMLMDLLNPRTKALLNSLGSRQLRWLSGVPIEALVELRKNNENSEFRHRLSVIFDRLHKSALGDTDKVASEVYHEVEAIINEHDREIKDIQARYERKYTVTMVAAWGALAASLVPTLAPFIGGTAPFALAFKYATDKRAELADKSRLSKSLFGVIASASRTSP